MRSSFKLTTILLIIILTGALVRVAGLGSLGIWGDEAFSISVGRMALPQIIEGGRDTHPPLFHVILHYWMMLVGRSEFATRFLALIDGVILIPTTYVMARRLINTRSGLAAAVLVALSPFAVYYSQEARMYAQTALFTTLSVYSFVRLVDSDKPRQGLSWRWVLVYGAFTLPAMYSHYYVFFVIAVQNVYALWRWRKQLRRALSWIGVQAALAVLYLPWVLAQVGYLSGKANQRWDAWGPDGMVDVWVNTLIAFGIGATPSPDTQILALGVLALAVLGGVFVWRQTGGSRLGRFAVIVTVVPLIIAWAVGPIMPFFYERFLLPILPPYLTLVAAGVMGLVERGRCGWVVASLAVVIAAAGPGLINLNKPEFAKSNYREIVAAINEQAQPGDGILLLNPEQQALYMYYRNRDFQAYVFPPAQGWDAPENQRQMRQIEERHPRLWLILFGNARDWDPAGNLQGWLNEYAFRASHVDYIDAGLELYVLGNTEPNTPLEAEFGDAIRLTGYGVSSDHVSPGGTVQVALAWECLQGMDVDYTIFTHIVSDQQVIAGQSDSQPGSGANPTSTWTVSETNIDRFAVQIGPETPAGTYYLQIGWYDLATLERLQAVDSQGAPLGDHVILIPIIVQ